MSQEHLLINYSSSIKRLKLQCDACGMSDDEFKKMYLDSLEEVERSNVIIPQGSFNFILNKTKIILSILLTFVVIYNFKPIYSTILCNLQEYIYPGLRLLRRISIPFISLFPSLSVLYDETCLIQNPYFTVVDMDCWPCSSVNNIREITDPLPSTQLHNAPFIYKTDQKTINVDELKQLYDKNKKIFDIESPKLFTNNKYYITPSDMFNKILQRSSSEKHLFVWKFNNMGIARILRQIIPRPKIVPKFGQSTERFLVIDTSQTSFKIPDTECNFSFILSLKGSRQIYLIPAEECKNQCKTLQVELRESHLLWYNWWYWRPVAQPSYNNETLIAHIGSYC